MTELEAKAILEQIMPVDPEWIDAIDLAIKALEKQIPMDRVICFDRNDPRRLPINMCPRCMERVVMDKYCDRCGQAIDWE